MANQTPIRLVDDDPLAITNELVQAYEAASGKVLYPAQIERLFIDLIAYRETLVRALINDVARQNLVAYARAPMLDYLGELVGVARLPAQPARTTLRFTRAAAAGAPTLVPAGALVQAAPGISFAAELDALIPAGAAAAFADVPAVCTQPGEQGNGFLPGQLTVPHAPLPASVAVANRTLTASGASAEGDERLRERIRLAPESFSVAGPRMAYRFAAMSASPQVRDVAVLSPAPGVVRLHPLAINGMPSPELKALVMAAASAEDARPLCDFVEVADPLPMPFSVAAQLTLYRDADSAATLAAARDALDAYCDQVAAGLGRDVVRSQIIAALSLPGVYRVHLAAPSADLEVPPQGWAHAVARSVIVSGAADG